MTPMVIQVNGESMSFEQQLTIKELIVELELADGPVAVERNGEVVTRARHPDTALCDGDVLEIVHFVGGG